MLWMTLLMSWRGVACHFFCQSMGPNRTSRAGSTRTRGGPLGGARGRNGGAGGAVGYALDDPDAVGGGAGAKPGAAKLGGGGATGYLNGVGTTTVGGSCWRLAASSSSSSERPRLPFALTASCTMVRTTSMGTGAARREASAADEEGGEEPARALMRCRMALRVRSCESSVACIVVTDTAERSSSAVREATSTSAAFAPSAFAVCLLRAEMMEPTASAGSDERGPSAWSAASPTN
ncbi:hypothetical protein DFH06DRAFT_1241418 [Mycena polygramma]|nr:hypothetical protein DFH06DRAFT_1241418 [Mycena polygramma]